MENVPEIIHNQYGRFWRHVFNSFEALVFLPDSPLSGDILNYGFNAPYLLVFAEKQFTYEEAALFAREKGLDKIAASFDSSVVFINPVTESGDFCGWEYAKPDILSEIISNSRIHQCYKDGYVIANNFFTRSCEGYFIRGAIFRIFLYGLGKGADYIAKNCLHHFEGAGLWGPSDLAPATCVLSGLSVLPDVRQDDIPVISYGNSKQINEIFSKNCKFFLSRQTEDLVNDYYGFVRKFRRMTGPLQIDPDLEKDGLVIEPGIAEVKTSSDNCGDDKDKASHKIGYFAFYNKDLKGPLPLVLGFHGGGDSCFFFSTMAGWAKIAHKYNFLLVTVENHLNSTASEMVEFVEILKKKFDIDASRIYATGFSMGGCKTWDIIQEHPSLLAAAAPMDATFDVGCNVYGKKIQTELNESVMVPVFYAGGEVSPLPELPFQAQKCLDRVAYVLRLNKANSAELYSKTVKLEDKDKWQNKIWGLDGDLVRKEYDPVRDATLKMQLFRSKTDGRALSVFASISGQGHDCREHTCEHAWRFMSRFSRDADGNIKGGYGETDF